MWQILETLRGKNEATSSNTVAVKHFWSLGNNASWYRSKEFQRHFFSFIHLVMTLFLTYLFVYILDSRHKIIKRRIFQTCWKVHCCTKSLFFELETSNLGSLLIFLISFDCAKFQNHWATFILDILQWSPLWFFGE